MEITELSKDWKRHQSDKPVGAPKSELRSRVMADIESLSSGRLQFEAQDMQATASFAQSPLALNALMAALTLLFSLYGLQQALRAPAEAVSLMSSYWSFELLTFLSF